MKYYPSVRYVLLLLAGTTAGASLFQKLNNESGSDGAASTDLHEEHRNLRVALPSNTYTDPRSVSPRNGGGGGLSLGKRAASRSSDGARESRLALQEFLAWTMGCCGAPVRPIRCRRVHGASSRHLN